MKEWKIRITSKYLADEKIRVAERLKEISEDYLIINEFWNDNKQPLDHLQMYVNTAVSERKLRALVKSCLTQGGNEAFSMDNRHSDWNGYKGYLMKYDDSVVLQTSYTKEELDHFRKYYFDVSAPKVKFKKELKLEKDLEAVLELTRPGMCIKDILNVIIDYYKKNRKIMHLANINQLAWSVSAYMNGNDALIQKLLDMDEGLYGIDPIEIKEKRRFDARKYDIPE